MSILVTATFLGIWHNALNKYMLDAIQDIVGKEHEGVVPDSVHRGLPTDGAI